NHPDRPLGCLLGVAAGRGGVAHPGGGAAYGVSGAGRRPSDGLLGAHGGVGHRCLHVVHLLAHLFLGSARHVCLVADGLHGLAHLGSGLLYFLADLVWVLAHCTSSLTVSMVCSGTGGTACLTRSRPRKASTAATPADTTATMRAASQAGMTMSSNTMKQVVNAAAANRPTAPAAPNRPAPIPACLPFWLSSALARSSS